MIITAQGQAHHQTLVSELFGTSSFDLFLLFVNIYTLYFDNIGYQCNHFFVLKFALIGGHNGRRLS